MGMGMECLWLARFAARRLVAWGEPVVEMVRAVEEVQKEERKFV